MWKSVHRRSKTLRRCQPSTSWVKRLTRTLEDSSLKKILNYQASNLFSNNWFQSIAPSDTYSCKLFAIRFRHIFAIFAALITSWSSQLLCRVVSILCSHMLDRIPAFFFLHYLRAQKTFNCLVSRATASVKVSYVKPTNKVCSVVYNRYQTTVNSMKWCVWGAA